MATTKDNMQQWGKHSRWLSSNTVLTRRHLCRDLGHRVNKAIVSLPNECINPKTPRASAEVQVYCPKAARASDREEIYKDSNSQVHSLKSKHGRKRGAPESTVWTGQNKCVPNSFLLAKGIGPQSSKAAIRPGFRDQPGHRLSPPGRPVAMAKPAREDRKPDWSAALRTGFWTPACGLNVFLVGIVSLKNKNKKTLVTVVLLTMT